LTVERIIPPILERFIKTDLRLYAHASTCRGDHRAFGPVGSGGAELSLREMHAAKFPNDIEKPPNQSRWRIDVVLQSDHRVAGVLEQRSYCPAEAFYPCR